MSLSIPKPCSEDWDKMTPTEKGAFCQKCAVDVVDFSQKSNEEIKQILTQNTGKRVCGRFEKKQLHHFNYTYANWKNQSNRTFQSKFLWACLIVFGMTFFTGFDNVQAQHSMQNLVALHPEPEDSTTIHKIPSVSEPTDSTQTFPEPLQFIKGEIAYIPQPVDTSRMILRKVDLSTNCEIQDSLNPAQDSTDTHPTPVEPEILPGKVIMIEEPEVISPEPVITDSILVKISSPVFDAELLPNPTVNAQTTLQIHPKHEGMYHITVHTLSGTLLQTVHQGKLRANAHQFKINMTRYPSGVYLVRITDGNIVKSLKMHKVM